jgi:uncharacterized membrane protein SpoIIM required for sporulation/ABC-type transport system involved in multi-copper enzyme maturation permease subunit
VAVVVRREIRDTLRDWRLVLPIIVLTLFFPVLMSGFADLMLNYVAMYGGNPLIGERLLPFLLLVCGFFPISFSLVIALETFVGEKERGSLEPLLATPLSDAQLYVGKMLGAMIPPLLASYLGIGVYLAGLYFTKNWVPQPILLVLVLVLTTGEALVMVAGAVVVSSQTTSVRAANLLASFIIIPMALLVQGEAVIMFWANYDVLWWIVVFLAVVDVVLVRAGVRLFNREELLGREIDELNLPNLWRTFRGFLRSEPWWFGHDPARLPRRLRWLARIGGLYRHDLPAILQRCGGGAAVVLGGVLLSVGIGVVYASRYPLPVGAVRLESISPDLFSSYGASTWLPRLTAWNVLAHNVRALLMAAVVSVFSLGTLGVALLMVPLSIIWYFTAQMARLGYSPGLFLAAFVAPHGVVELPAAILATALAVRLGAALIAPPRHLTVGAGWLRALADFIKGFAALVLPLLALAAIIEAHVTPQIVVWAFAR